MTRETHFSLLKKGHILKHIFITDLNSYNLSKCNHFTLSNYQLILKIVTTI